MKREPVKVKLFEDYEVEVNTQLLDDFDFVKDMSKAAKESDIDLLYKMNMALIGGDKAEKDVRSYITKEHGYFSVEALQDIFEKIQEALPKAGPQA